MDITYFLVFNRMPTRYIITFKITHSIITNIKI